jgi:hypothetical protein
LQGRRDLLGPSVRAAGRSRRRWRWHHAREQDNFEVEVQGLEDDDFRPGYIRDAAVHTVSLARVDYRPEDFEPDRLDEEELDYDQWDASYHASLAAAGTGPREPGGDSAEAVTRRREFWRWYLSEAVPAAFRANRLAP